MTSGALPALAVFVAVALGATLDATIKHLGAVHGAWMLAFGRYVAGSLVAGAIYVFTDRRRMTAQTLRFHAVRGVLVTISGATFFYALTVLPLVEAITIGFLAPLIVPFTAFVLLRERPSASSLIAAAVGFVGVLIAVAAPPSADAHPDHAKGLAAAFVAVFTYALSLTLLRMRAGEDGPVVTTLLANVIPALLLATPALLAEPVPGPASLPFFALAGTLGAGLWMLMAWAYARAPAASLAPLEYTALIWSAAFGYALFDETPRLQTILGGLVIAGACVWLAWDQQRRVRPA